MENDLSPSPILRDPLLTLTSIRWTGRYSRNHFHPAVNELVAANDNDDDPDPPTPNWTAATVVSRPNGQLATYHKKKPTFMALSHKTKRLVSEESPWENLYRVLWNLDPDVLDFEGQGLTITLVTPDHPDGALYTIDAILAMSDGLHGHEIKASGSYFLDPDQMQLMVNVTDVLGLAGITMHKSTANALLSNRRLLDNLSYGRIHQYDTVPPDECEAVRRALSDGPKTYGDLKSLLGSDFRIQKAKAFSLLAKRLLRFDLAERLTDQSIVTAPLACSIPDIRNINRSFLK